MGCLGQCHLLGHFLCDENVVSHTQVQGLLNMPGLHQQMYSLLVVATAREKICHLK